MQRAKLETSSTTAMDEEKKATSSVAYDQRNGSS